jgi:hypothetical protein
MKSPAKSHRLHQSVNPEFAVASVGVCIMLTLLSEKIPFWIWDRYELFNPIQFDRGRRITYIQFIINLHGTYVSRQQLFINQKS